MRSLTTRLFFLLGLLFSALASATTPLNLTTGWNLLGNSSAVPIDVAATFGDASKITTVWKWNKTASKWAFYAPSMTPSALTTYAQGKGYDVLTSIDPKEGFWVNASAAAALTGPATSGVTLVESDLQQGWNLLGSADNKTPPQLNAGLSNSLSAAGKTIVTAWAWDAPNTKWKFYAPAMDAKGGTVLADYITAKGYLPFSAALSAAEGFWLNIATPVISLSVDVTTGQKPISDYIYGIHEIVDEKFAKEIGLPARRWGGNNTSRYNWRNYATNDGADWYFENVMYTNTYTRAAETHDQWIAQNERTKTKSVITVPMMGYVAKDGIQSTCSFSTANPSYGTQQDKIEAAWGCGNGLRGGQPLPSGAPLITSDPFAPADATAWINDLVMKHGTAAGAGVKFYSLDNEPDLWHETHRDIHPAAVTYNDILDLGLAYAKAIKAADSGALVLGPVQSGWMNYFLASHPHPFDQAKWDQAVLDRQNHGMDFIPWYLQQMQAASNSQGVQLLDYLDLHFYPSETGVGFPTKAGDAATQALRLKSTRVLWDPAYVDDSVIGQAGNSISPSQDNGVVRLIPRMKAWVKDYPKIKTAITEYYWGGLEDINGALTQADILGIFGREGLDMAFLFNYPETGLGIENFETLPGAYAFRMYRNYDGIGGRFGDTSVTASSADQGLLAIYAAKRSSDGATTVMVINKIGSTLTGNITMTGLSAPATAQVYCYSAGMCAKPISGSPSKGLAGIDRVTDQPVAVTGFSASFPANSITLFVIK